MKNQEIKQITKSAKAHERKRWAKMIREKQKNIGDVQQTNLYLLGSIAYAMENNIRFK